jgi:hypothetical protein
VVTPFFQIACLEQPIDQPQEPVVVDVLGQNPVQDRVIEPIEEAPDTLRASMTWQPGFAHGRRAC